MAIQLTETEIEALLAEPKPLPSGYRTRLRLRPKRGHAERDLDVVGERGGEFRLILRQSERNPLDFSIILAYRPPGTSQLLRLRRYNGKSHEHTNKLESQTFYGFHTHMATERYQDLGLREDAYAEPTDRYSDFDGALRCMLENCGFERPADEPDPLF